MSPHLDINASAVGESLHHFPHSTPRHFSTITDGPSLRGDLQELNFMPLGGVLTL